MSGKIEVFTGPMRSGKSAALLNKIHRFEIAGKNVIVFKPVRDQRDKKKVKSRTGASFDKDHKIFLIEKISEIFPIIDKEKPHLVAVDEFHFFEEDDNGENFVIKLIEYCNSNIHFAFSGLDLSHSGKPFHLLGSVMCVADEVNKFTAICCDTSEDNATMTLLSLKTDDIRVSGGDDIYKPVCRKSWWEEKNKK